jgi:ferredoxin-thioredoxin reductase catalytic subunit
MGFISGGGVRGFVANPAQLVENALYCIVYRGIASKLERYGVARCACRKDVET